MLGIATLHPTYTPTRLRTSVESLYTCARDLASDDLQQFGIVSVPLIHEITDPKNFRISPNITLRRYFGTKTTWYLQSHFEWERL